MEINPVCGSSRRNPSGVSIYKYLLFGKIRYKVMIDFSIGLSTSVSAHLNLSKVDANEIEILLTKLFNEHKKIFIRNFAVQPHDFPSIVIIFDDIVEKFHRKINHKIDSDLQNYILKLEDKKIKIKNISFGNTPPLLSIKYEKEKFVFERHSISDITDLISLIKFLYYLTK